MSKEKMVDFCTTCRKEVNFIFIKKVIKKVIRDKEYDFEITTAICTECNEEMDIPGLMDLNTKEVDEQYRKYENIVSIDEIQKLMDIYKLGKAPLSIALGFGEITITRYLDGQMPSKEYSDRIRKALIDPKHMAELLRNNAEKIGETAFNKAIKAANEIIQLFKVSEKMLLTISYIFEQMQEVTPLTLQKLLYYVQGIHLAKYGKPLYSENCYAWVHGPVYENVYNMFRDFQYNPIDDNRFEIFRGRYEELSVQEREVIDLVIKTFGIYSGKTLEGVTHNETPWLEAREGYGPTEKSHEMIDRRKMKDYFCEIANTYGLESISDINCYILKMLNNKHF